MNFRRAENSLEKRKLKQKGKMRPSEKGKVKSCGAPERNQSVYQLKLHKCTAMGDVKPLTSHQRLLRKINSLRTKRKASARTDLLINKDG